MSRENTNLLKETVNVLARNGKTTADVLWCGNTDFWFPWSTFERLANGEYYPGYGSPAVMTDLLVVGDGFWLERHEYDGSEWWEYKAFPRQPSEQREPKRLIDTLWPNLNEHGMRESDDQ